MDLLCGLNSEYQYIGNEYIWIILFYWIYHCGTYLGQIIYTRRNQFIWDYSIGV